MGRPRDWFDYADADHRIAIAEIALLGPKPLVQMGQFWGDGINVICAGDAGHASREAARLHWLKLWPQPCPRGHYDMYDEPVRSVVDRLPIWG